MTVSEGQGKYLKVAELFCGLTTDGFKAENSQLLKTQTYTRLRLTYPLARELAAKWAEVLGVASACAGY